MIPKNKLKFDERDLEFFDKQRDVEYIKLRKMHYFILMHINHRKRISAKQLAKLGKIEENMVRQLILEIRRYTEPREYFITANKLGYTKSCFKKCCEDELISYFNKTQTRFKETFNELCNLMKCLNKREESDLND